MARDLGVAPHESTHATSGSDALLSTDVIEAIVKRLRETGGPTTLALGAIADGELLKRSGATVVGSTVSAAIDAALGSTRGSVLERGASGWTVISPSGANKVFVDGGAGADPAWTTLSTLIDNAIGSTRGAVLYKGASGWAILAPGTSTHVLTSNGVGADPSYQAATAASASSLSANSDSGLSRSAAGVWKATDTSTTNYAILGSGGVRTQAAGVQGWSSSTDATAAADTGLSRDSAGVVDVGTGAQGSTAGSLKATNATLLGGLSLGPTAATLVAGQLSFGTGAGGITQILGPTDQNMILSAASPGSASTGRNLTLNSGPGGSTSGSTGSITIQPGVIASAGSGGTISILGRTGVGVGQTGSPITITAGGSVVATGGAFTAAAGAGNNDGAGGLFSVAGGAGGGTDQNAGGLTASTGLPTGTGTADYLVRSGFRLATGSTLQTAYDRQRITSKTFTCSTTTGTNNIYLVLSNAVSNSGVGCSVDYVLEVGDGANHWSTIAGVQTVSASNRNGTVTATCTTAGTSNQAISDVTTFTSLACTTTVAVSGTNVSIRLTPSWAAGTPTVVRVTYQARCSGQGNLTTQ